MHATKHWAVGAGALMLATPLVLAAPAIQVDAAGDGGPHAADKDKDKPDFPSFDEASKGYEKVVSTADGKPSLYTIWVRKKDQEVLAELPAGYANQRHYIALTMPTGESFAGLQLGEIYAYWKRFDKRMALVAPDLDYRLNGDAQSKDALGRHFVDTVLVDIPIVCIGPGGQPVIDMDELLVGNAGVFYGPFAAGVKKQLANVVKAKAFPENVELAFEVPASQGKVKTFHYSLSVIPENSSYKPRKADERVGFFTTVYKDLGEFRSDKVWVRNINRWQLDKADPKLKLSPPKEPIVFYLEHTVPVRYRRWIKQGITAWNSAFEKVGISDAIVVHYQDKETGAHMDKDPEDVRYNFVRWLSNDISTAIGPSRAHPLTGQILDADIVLTDGWIRAFWYQYNEFLPDMAMEGFGDETMRWLADHPEWDPRVRLAPPEERSRLSLEARKRDALGATAYELAMGDGAVLDDTELSGFADRVGSAAALCMASNSKAHDMALMGLVLGVLGKLDDEGQGGSKDGAGAEEEKEDEELIDGIPEWFVGPMMKDLVMHEVGHTLGLRHNFKASGNYTMAEINSPDFKGKRPFAGSVMDYLPVNVNMDDGEVQGDFAMIDIGPYDLWAIEYGYTFDDPEKVIAEVADPEHAYLTDEDTTGPDPLARRYDFAKDPLGYAESRMRLVDYSRARIIDEFVEDGESWSRARRGYEITLGTQLGSVSIMANWLGGAFVNRDRKGDPNARLPIEAVPADDQRAALAFVLEKALRDDAFGLTPDLLRRMTVDKWYDQGGMNEIRQDPTWPIHDRIAGIQASTLTMLMQPSTLRRVYDNELLVPAAEDAFTLAELMQSIGAEVWREVGYEPQGPVTRATAVEASAKKGSASWSARDPMISSLRRNLQREHLERLIDLTMQEQSGAAAKTVFLLARQQLADIGAAIDSALAGKPDVYTRAHLDDASKRIAKVLDAEYEYGGANGMGGLPIFLLMGQGAETR